MRIGRSDIGPKHLRVERAEADALCQLLAAATRLTVNQAEHSAKLPGNRQVRIEHQRAIDVSNPGVEIAAEMSDGVSTPRERDRVIFAQLHSAASQAYAFSNFLLAIGHPAIDLAPEVTLRSNPIGRCKIRVELDRLVKLGQCPAYGLLRTLMEVGHAAQVIIVGVEAVSRFVLGARYLRALQPRRDGAHDARCDLILQIEDIRERAFKTVRPKVNPGRCIDELTGNAHAIGGLAHAAFQHIANAELTARLLHVDSTALVGEA